MLVCRRYKFGFSLVELLVGAVIVLVTLLLVFAIALASHRNLNDAGLRLDALMLAQSEIEIIKSTSFTGLPPEVHYVRGMASVRLAHGNLVKGSVRIYELNGDEWNGEWSVDEQTGVVHLRAREGGEWLVIEYSYMRELPSHGKVRRWAIIRGNFISSDLKQLVHKRTQLKWITAEVHWSVLERSSSSSKVSLSILKTL